ncbi:MAG: hypothetical protein KY468_16970 [Armatimonadetes bacterium]|nr:hypothetical protein [Armatimonadota bacterium]
MTLKNHLIRGQRLLIAGLVSLCALSAHAQLTQPRGTLSPPGPNGISSPAIPESATAVRPFDPNALLRELQQSDVYVAPTLADRVSEPNLERLAGSYGSNEVKVVVIPSVPTRRQGGDTTNIRHSFTKNLHDYMKLRDGLMVVVVPEKGVSAWSNSLSWGKMRGVIQESRLSFSEGIEPGVKSIADNTFATVQGQQRSSGMFWTFLLLAAVIFMVVVTNRKKAARKKRITELNRSLIERMAALQDEFKRFDLEAAQADNSPLIQEAKQLRSAAVDPFAAAGEVYNVATTVEQYEEADRLTTQAEKLAARARVRLDQSLGKRPLDEPGTAGSIPRAEDVPKAERGACFFCSKPTRMQDLRSLEINVEGDSRRVLACEDCYDIARTGRQPQVLTVPEEGGRRVPWYQSQRYDPWNDYGRGGGVFGGGGFFGGGFGLMDYLLLENLFDRNYSQPTVITPNDPGYAGHAGSADSGWAAGDDSTGDFFGGVFGGSDSSSDVGDFFGSDSGGGIFDAGDMDVGDFFGGGD